MIENKITIVTNGHVRELVSVNQLPASAQPAFDYIEGMDRDETRIVKYRNAFYDINEFWFASGEFELAGWSGVHNETFFSGLCVKLAEGDDGVVIGRYYC